MIGVVIPAHDEEDHIGFCLQSVLRAARCPALAGEQVLMVVALDRCSDATERVARQMGAFCVKLDAGNVGAARAKAAQLALDIGVRWLAFTDADSVVAPDWLSAQVNEAGDAHCGAVAVHDGGSYEECLQRHSEVATAVDGPRAVHGASLGVSAAAYCRAGGFLPLATSEDIAFVQALERSGAQVTWSAKPRVVTSAARSHRGLATPGAPRPGVARAEAAAELPVRPLQAAASTGLPAGGWVNDARSSSA